jgi:hypothetical protein
MGTRFTFVTRLCSEKEKLQPCKDEIEKLLADGVLRSGGVVEFTKGDYSSFYVHGMFKEIHPHPETLWSIQLEALEAVWINDEGDHGYVE